MSGAIQERNLKNSPPCHHMWENHGHEHEAPLQSSRNTEWRTWWESAAGTALFPSGCVPEGWRWRFPRDRAVRLPHKSWALGCGFVKFIFTYTLFKWRKIMIFTVIWSGVRGACQEERLEVCVYYSPELTEERKITPELVSTSLSTIWRPSASQWCVSWAGNSRTMVQSAHKI